MLKSLLRGAAVLTLALSAAGCDDDSTSAPTLDIVQTAQASGNFNTLLTAVQAAGLTATLKGEGPFTVFAPTDAAFAAIPPATLNALLANQQQLTAVLTYHVVPGEVRAAQALTLSSAPTVNGKPLTLANTSGTLRVNNATVVQTDILTTNGVIHVIDAVLLP